MASSSFVTNFAPYQPPPDDPEHLASTSSSTTPTTTHKFSRPWFPSLENAPSTSNVGSSYQSGGLPTFGTALSNGGFGSEGLEGREDNSPQTLWKTRFGMRVDILAAFAYVFGPVSALLLLIFETHNDYVRFNAYQSALLTAPLLLLRVLFALLRFPAFFTTGMTLVIALAQLYMAFIAYRNASRRNLERHFLPYIGHMADAWVAEE